MRLTEKTGGRVRVANYAYTNHVTLRGNRKNLCVSYMSVYAGMLKYKKKGDRNRIYFDYFKTTSTHHYIVQCALVEVSCLKTAHARLSCGRNRKLYII